VKEENGATMFLLGLRRKYIFSAISAVQVISSTNTITVAYVVKDCLILCYSPPSSTSAGC